LNLLPLTKVIALRDEIKERADELRKQVRNGRVIIAESYPKHNDIFDDTDRAKWVIRREGGTDHCVGYNVVNGETGRFPLEEMEGLVEAYGEHDQAEITVVDLDDLHQVVRGRLLEATPDIEEGDPHDV